MTTRSSNASLTIDVGRGRLLIAGSGSVVLANLPGMFYDFRRGTVTATLTLETLRACREALGVTRRVFASYCTPRVLEWAQWAAALEARAQALHAAPVTAETDPLPWRCHRDVTLAGHLYRAGDYVPPFAHQRVLAQFAGQLPCAFVCDVGTGKTRACIEALPGLRASGRVGPIVVVAPKRVQRTWRDEVPLWIGWETLSLEGRVADRRRILADSRNWSRVFLLNYEVLSRMHDDLKVLPRLGIIFDEGHKLRNPQAQQTKAAISVALAASWRALLTGSPVIQGAHELWSQWYVVDHGVTFGQSFPMFTAAFFSKDPFGRYSPRAGTLQTVGRRMLTFGLRYRKAECLDLPPRVYQTLEVELPPDVRRAYRTMAEHLLAEVETAGGVEQVTAANQLVVYLRLSQITSGFLPANGELHRFPVNVKLDALEEYVDENLDAQQIVVWCRYREDIRAICARLARYNPVVIQGAQTKAEERAMDEAISAFQSGASRLLVANPASGGAGINLQRGSIAVYYSQSFNYEYREQSEGRIHRAGSEQHAQITYVDLVASNTVDTIVSGALRDKDSVAKLVTDLRYHLQQEVQG